MDNKIVEELKYMLTQWRMCKKLEPRIIESNFLTCLKKMFNKNYKPKTYCWWVGRCIIDIPGIQVLVISMLHNHKINFIDVFVKFNNDVMSLKIYILFKDNKYDEIAII